MAEMTNADLFLRVFGIYATELCAMPEQQLLEWLNAPCDRERLKDMLSEQLNEAHNEGYDVGYWAGRRDYEQKWIPCSERLPDEGEKVLATHLGGLNPNRQVIEHIYQNGKFTGGWDMDTDVHSPTFGQRFMGKVIAWMPLPEPYKEDK